MNKHGGEKSQKCDQCSYACFMKTDLRKHVNRVHLKISVEEKSHTCNQCDYASDTKGDLKNHMTKHNEDKFFICN